MPFYEYFCKECGSIIEEYLTIKESEEPRYCPECESEIKKLLGSCDFILKGNGFYATDYKEKK